MNTLNVHAGWLERRVRLMGNEIMPGFHRLLLFAYRPIRRVTKRRCPTYPAITFNLYLTPIIKEVRQQSFQQLYVLLNTLHLLPSVHLLTHLQRFDHIPRCILRASLVEG